MKRAASGRFAATCNGKIHEEVQSHSSLIDLISGKRISKKNYDRLIATNQLSENPRHICKTCMVKLLEQPSVTFPPPQNENEEENFDEYLQYLSEKAIQLAKELYPLLLNDIGNLRKEKLGSVEQILEHSTASWTSSTPIPLVHLLYTLCGVDMETASESQIVLIGKALENIYSCMNSKVVLPNHFIENLLCYSLTNCKSYLNFLSKRSPGGGYTYICNWLQNQSREPIKFLSGLVKCVFDNSQKIGKTHLISSTNKVPTSVITSQLWITFDKENSIQKTSHQCSGLTKNYRRSKSNAWSLL